ncbi:hypothetical protein ACIQI7_21690 [Kitasatospora sp. NPDC092039]|uniref:hypothetical protein n=1 Tax=Kitasatospora sp. NPDC092039 TaxID=3364086 RepID=UPI003826C8EA
MHSRCDLACDHCHTRETGPPRVGISLDGDQAANDRHRRSVDGRPQVLATVELLRSPRYREFYAEPLCTTNPADDTVAARIFGHHRRHRPELSATPSS